MTRLLVCDPACFQEIGHNVAALKYFSQAFKNSFDDVVAICSRSIPSRLAKESGFTPFFRTYYNHFFSDMGPEQDWSGVDHDGFLDSLEALATADARLMIDRWNIGFDDVVMFPHLDFYGVIGLLNVLAGMPKARQPKVLLRFIHVMENASHSYPDPEAELLGRINDLAEKELRLRFSAETPVLADRLSMFLDRPVSVTMFPISSRSKPLAAPEGEQFVVYCPGSARLDKGFLKLEAIFRAVREVDTALKITFVVQGLPRVAAMDHQAYARQLFAMPGVEFLPSAISEQEMLRQYARCCLVLLPYERGVYALRGSAALMEAAAFGRQVLTLEGLGFTEQVRYFALGSVVDRVEDMAAEILKIAGEKRAKLVARAVQSRHRFAASTQADFRVWAALQ
ncbi:hypothetical protein [Brevundimonas sp.]|uniref:hypothetical protein n=1 Tax=Brevundimonas sp. TaxID=1871086 RepID=UPI00289D1B38|nr:hypothetical protein [Brevundimonas sp.]